MIQERERRLVIRALVAGSVVMVVYWAAWYGHRSLVASDTTTSYYPWSRSPLG